MSAVGLLLRQKLEHLREIHKSEDMDAVFDCVFCGMMETELARTERAEKGGEG